MLETSNRKYPPSSEPRTGGEPERINVSHFSPPTPSTRGLVKVLLVQMSEGGIPRFAKTNGETQRRTTQRPHSFDGDPSFAKEGSGVSAFFRSLKNKLRKTESLSTSKNGVFGSTIPKGTPDDKTYFIKATGQATMARPMFQTTKVFCLFTFKT